MLSLTAQICACRKGPTESPVQRRLASGVKRRGKQGAAIWRESQLDLVMDGTWALTVILDNLEEQFGRKRMNVCEVQWPCRGVGGGMGGGRVRSAYCCRVQPTPLQVPTETSERVCGFQGNTAHFPLHLFITYNFRIKDPFILQDFLVPTLLKMQIPFGELLHFSLNEFIHPSLRVLGAFEFTELLGIGGCWGTG